MSVANNTMLSRTRLSFIDFPLLLDDEVKRLPIGSTIIELGGGANPSLSAEQVAGHCYIIIDISEGELRKADGDYYEQIVADVSKDQLDLTADLVFSRMVLEHVPHPKAFHTAIYQMLKPAGRALHFYATLYSPATVINILLPEWITDPLVKVLQKERRDEKKGKFKAYYRWTKGPTGKQKQRLQNCGFQIVMFNGYIGSGYLHRIPILNKIERLYNRLALKISSPLLCSNAIVILERANKPKATQ